jgi:hypothetical protein
MHDKVRADPASWSGMRGADYGGRPHRRSVKLIDNTVNGEQEIARELAPPADALRVALMMLARRGRLEIGDVLKVEAPR